MTVQSRETAANAHEVGIVRGVKDYILEIEGFPSARVNALLHDASTGMRSALVHSFDADLVTALMLDKGAAVHGEEFYATDERIRLPSITALIKRIVDPLGRPLDGGPPPPLGDLELGLDVVAMGMDTREEIVSQLVSGVTLIDTLVPIGKGQRELIVGPARSGKTTFVRDVIVSQKRSGALCIYGAVGKPAATINRFVKDLRSRGADVYTIIIATTADDPPPLISLVPAAAFSLAESARSLGQDVVLIIDDLATHAKYLREVALLSGIVPGRESYPGDIFYQHAHLMERAGNFNAAAGGGSITLLPLLEMELDRLTDLIPTNAMASTDGHIFFSAEKRAQGYYPSAELGSSVTRVGRKTQLRAQKEIAERIQMLLADHEARSVYSRFGAELSPETKKMIREALSAIELLKQEPVQFIDPTVQVALLALIFTPFLENRTEVFVRENKTVMIRVLENAPEFAAARSFIKDNQGLDAVLKEITAQQFVLERECHSDKQ